MFDLPSQSTPGHPNTPGHIYNPSANHVLNLNCASTRIYITKGKGFKFTFNAQLGSDILKNQKPHFYIKIVRKLIILFI